MLKPSPPSAAYKPAQALPPPPRSPCSPDRTRRRPRLRSAGWRRPLTVGFCQRASAEARPLAAASATPCVGILTSADPGPRDRARDVPTSRACSTPRARKPSATTTRRSPPRSTALAVQLPRRPATSKGAAVPLRARPLRHVAPRSAASRAHRGGRVRPWPASASCCSPAERRTEDAESEEDALREAMAHPRTSSPRTRRAASIAHARIALAELLSRASAARRRPTEECSSEALEPATTGRPRRASYVPGHQAARPVLDRDPRHGAERRRTGSRSAFRVFLRRRSASSSTRRTTRLPRRSRAWALGNSHSLRGDAGARARGPLPAGAPEYEGRSARWRRTPLFFMVQALDSRLPDPSADRKDPEGRGSSCRTRAPRSEFIVSYADRLHRARLAPPRAERTIYLVEVRLRRRGRFTPRPPPSSRGYHDYRVLTSRPSRQRSWAPPGRALRHTDQVAECALFDASPSRTRTGRRTTRPRSERRRSSMIAEQGPAAAVYAATVLGALQYRLGQADDAARAVRWTAWPSSARDDLRVRPARRPGVRRPCCSSTTS